jgi:hypothetical protein
MLHPPLAARPPIPREGRFRGRDRGGPARTEPRAQRPASGRASRNVTRGLKATVHGPNPFEEDPQADSFGRSLISGFAFQIPASSVCARSVFIPGTCDLTHRRTDAFDSAAPGARRGPHIPAP